MRRPLFLLAALFLAACRQAPTLGDTPDAPTSPQANAIPASLEAVAATRDAQVALPDSGPPPSPMRGDRALPPDVIATTHELREANAGATSLKEKEKEKDLVAWSLVAMLRSGDVAGPPKAPEVSLAGIEAARKQTEPRLTIDFAATRARIVLATRGFALPVDTEIRARADRYGHVVILPDAATYGVAPPGALRALLGERRLDVAPLLSADISARGDGAARVSFKTRRFDVTTRAASATFEIAHVDGAGEGGALVCRALLDLMNADPATPLCGADDVPLHADLHWAPHGVLTFDAIALAKRNDLAPQLLATPPATLSYSADAPSPLPAAVLLTSAELAAFRTTAIEAAPASRDAGAYVGLALANATDEQRFAYIDGVAAAWVAPGGGIEITGLPHGRYTLQWRAFLGDAVDPPQTISVPGHSRAGEGDGGI